MRRHPSKSLLATASLAVLTASAALAVGGQADDAPHLISLRFPGGTAVAYINAIRKAAGDLNVVVASEAGEIRMPPVSLNRVTPAAAVDLLNDRSHREHDRRVELEVRVMPTYDVAEQPTYQIMAHVSGRPTAIGAHVWTIAQILTKDITAEGVLSAVEMALEIAGSGTKPDIRFHEDTQLIIARGDQAQLEAIEEVIVRLNDAREESRRTALQDMKAHLAEVDAARAEAFERLAGADAAAQQASEETRAFQREMERLEVRVEELHRIVERKEHELAKARSEIRALETALQAAKNRSGIFSERPDD